MRNFKRLLYVKIYSNLLSIVVKYFNLPHYNKMFLHNTFSLFVYFFFGYRLQLTNQRHKAEQKKNIHHHYRLLDLTQQVKHLMNYHEQNKNEIYVSFS
jgi:hypothetical protein